VIRRQPDALAASYAQYVRRGGTYSAAAYLGLGNGWSCRAPRPDKRPEFDLADFSYLPLLRLYRRAFGSERVHVYLYEEFKADPAAFMNRLCVDHGLTLARDVCPRPGRVTKKSYPPWLLWLARCLNRLTRRDVVNKHCWVSIPGWYWVARGLAEGLCRLAPARAGAAAVLGPERVAAVSDYYAPGNAALEREFSLPLSRHHYPLPDRPSKKYAAARSSNVAPLLPATANSSRTPA